MQQWIGIGISTARTSMRIVAYSQKKWRGPEDWTRADTSVNRLSYTSNRFDAIPRSLFATSEGTLQFWAPLSLDARQAAHGLQLPA
jgi:hypothetical protein